jgi:osmotically inducible protein OsmC
MSSEKILYSTSARVSGGRSGTATTDDGRLSVKLATPPALGGTEGEGTNPEQLFAAGYAACFQSALMLVARRQRLDASNSIITGTVRLHPTEQKTYKLSVSLAVELPGIEPEAAQRLIELAHQVCPYSNAIRGNVDVELSLVEANPVS